MQQLITRNSIILPFLRTFTLTLLTIFSTIYSGSQAPTTYHHPQKNHYPNDISFCIVDLKFDGTTIKICEFGEGLESRFQGYEALYGPGAMWQKVWPHLASYRLPIFTVRQNFSAANTQEYAYPALTKLSKVMAPTLEALTEHTLFQQAHQRASNRTNNGQRTTSIASHVGLILAPTAKKSPDKLAALHKNFHTNNNQSTFLLLGKATTRFVVSKSATDGLFTTPELTQFRPRSIIIPKVYDPSTAQRVNEQLKSPLIVVKPLNAALGNGVIIIEAERLDHLLKLIATKSPALRNQGDRSSYDHWLSSTGSQLLVESFHASKTITVSNKKFNPTMRVAFCLANDAGAISITFMGSYWKLPAYSLDEPGTLIQHHKSSISHDNSRISSAFVDPIDYLIVQANLCKVLPGLYERMLADTTTKN